MKKRIFQNRAELCRFKIQNTKVTVELPKFFDILMPFCRELNETTDERSSIVKTDNYHAKASVYVSAMNRTRTEWTLRVAQQRASSRRLEPIRRSIVTRGRFVLLVSTHDIYREIYSHAPSFWDLCAAFRRNYISSRLTASLTWINAMRAIRKLVQTYRHR